ncbi:MAG TPA: CPBP family intramembrane glutamic endopeptidase [Acidimicrobiales bacterium]|nr:CPBP family intramembrane glutamic endopeptidase [Acidimicrobiales bacterium]
MAEVPDERPSGLANRFGLVEALFGFLGGELAGSLLAGAANALAGHTSRLGEDVGGLVGLWLGLLAAVLAASSAARRRGERPGVLDRLHADYGLALRPSDIPLGIAVGLASAYLLVPALTLPLTPFVHHLSERLSAPSKQLAEHVDGTGYVALALLVCVGTPVVEELFFRGLVLRAALGRLGGGRAGTVGAVLVTGALFGLAHFQPIELLALAGFGCVLCVLALRTGRLGAGMFAHATFNALTIISLARSH